MSRASAARSSALVLAVCALSCATAPAQERAREPQLAHVEGTGAAEVHRALAPAVAALAARGLTLTGPPRIVVHANGTAFREASGQLDPALRAWSTWRTVHLMPLSTWTKHDEQGVRQRITHELCHVAIYHRFGTEARARAVKIPRFFEEGVCSVVAGQERPDLMTIAYVAPPTPFTPAFFLADPEVAYAAAHHAIAFLDRKLEPPWLGDVLDRAAADGAPGAIERALLEVTGYDPTTLWRAVVTSLAAPSEAAAVDVPLR